MPADEKLAPETPDLVWFRGTDTIRFLNDLLSQEIATTGPGTVVRSLLLDPQGRLGHILWVLRGEDEVGLVTDQGRGDELVSALGRYRIRVQVEIEKETDPVWLVVGEMGTVPGGWESTDQGVVADVSWAKTKRALRVGERSGLETMDRERYEELRIRSGEPRFGKDVDDKTIPQQTGLVPVSVAFEKGCFLGQELVARINSRGGNVPQRIGILEFEHGAPPEGSSISHQGDEVGKITSAAGSLALGMIRREVTMGQQVEVDGRTAVVTGPVR
jgi:folate-binding protein YgfZ